MANRSSRSVGGGREREKKSEEDMEIKSPDFFIVGAPRCGTTALYSYLRQHPDVFLPEYKEPHYFNTDMESGGANRDQEKYLSLFSPAQDKKTIREASVLYLLSAITPQTEKDFSPTRQI